MMLARMRFPSRSARLRICGPACLAFLIALSALPVKTEEPLVFAITNARIVPVAGSPIDKGTIVIRRGVIEAVGAGVAIPGDARVLEATGLTAYPGLIDDFSDIGLEEPAAARGASPAAATPAPGRGAQQVLQPAAVPPDERQGLTPYRRGFEGVNPANRKIESARAVGITAASVVPRRGFFPGQGSLLSLSGAEIGPMVIRPSTAFFINTSSRTGGGAGGGGTYPSSLMGILAFVKQTLLDAAHYSAAWHIYRANPGTQRPEYSRALEALEPVLRRETPVVLPADSPAEIQRALDLADSYKLNLMLMGCAEGSKMGAALKSQGIPVLLAVKYPDRPAGTDPDFREELDSLRRRVEAPANAAALAKAGVRFALVSDDMANPRDFMNNINRAIEAGLDRDIALRSLTIIPAELLGVADRLGTIERKKTASLILATGDMFDPKTRVKHVFVDGRKFDIPEPQAAPPGAAGRGGPGR